MVADGGQDRLHSRVGEVAADLGDERRRQRQAAADRRAEPERESELVARRPADRLRLRPGRGGRSRDLLDGGRRHPRPPPHREPVARCAAGVFTRGEAARLHQRPCPEGQPQALRDASRRRRGEKGDRHPRLHVSDGPGLAAAAAAGHVHDPRHDPRRRPHWHRTGRRDLRPRRQRQDRRWRRQRQAARWSRQRPADRRAWSRSPRRRCRQGRRGRRQERPRSSIERLLKH